MRRALDYSRLPAPALVLPFLLAAPWFGVAAGCLLARRGADVFASRWSGAALAVTHLLTLGYLAQAMAGALLQMLPAVAGLPLRGARGAALAGPLLGGGALALAAAFSAGRPRLFAGAALLLAGGFALLLACLCATLARGRAAPAVAHVAGAMRGAVVALAACVTAGLLLAAWLAGGPAPAVVPLVDSHAALGLVGWVACLVVGVSLQVIPMFGPTDPFPPWAARALAPALLGVLAVWLACRWMAPDWRHAAALAGLLPVACHAAASGGLLLRRERTRRNPLTRYWLLALASFVAAASLFAWPAEPSAARQLAIGVCFLGGFALSVVNGMLYRIVPFLLWYHVRDRALPGATVPKLGELVAEERMAAQWRWHLAAVAAGLAACVQPTLAPLCGRLCGFLLAAACLRLGVDLARPALRHRRLLLAQAS